MPARPKLAIHFHSGHAIAFQTYLCAARRLSHRYACAARLSQKNGIQVRAPGLISESKAGSTVESALERHEAALARSFADPSWIAYEAGVQDAVGNAQFGK